MKRAVLVVIFSALTLVGCETPTSGRYSISADNNVAIKSLGVNGVGVAPFRGPATFDASCRAIGPIQLADDVTHAQYLQKAFEDEFKIAGAYSPSPSRVTISGDITKLEFSSTRAVTGGSWTIEVRLASSNGQSLQVNEYYEFSSGFNALSACRETADAFPRAVQNLVGKALRSPDFARMVR